DAVHYVKKEETAPHLTVQQAWFNKFGGLLKVATERTSAAARELKEFFPFDPDEDPAARRMFVLIRREHPLPNGATRVDEERLYLQRKASTPLVTVRKLTKTAEFKAGQALDMEHVRNVVSTPSQGPAPDSAEAAQFDWELMEQPVNIARALRDAGAQESEAPAANKEVDPAKKEKGWAVNAVSPDGQWALRLIPAAEGKEAAFVIVKRQTQQTAVTLSEEAAGTFADTARIVWAPDSKRFAFHYKPGLRVQHLQLFQLDGGEWRELDAPHEDDVTDAPIRRSMAAQRKKLKLPPDESGRPISARCEVRRWLDPSTALLFVSQQETFEIKDELEQVGDGCFLTLKFEANGEWKITRTHSLSEQKRTALNKAEQDELAKMAKESEEEN
ncbi:MAG: hypothetical protein ACJ8KC_09800, partial [Candidatus Udaeobacter sp.]